jgi:MOSC domain-containing protein YiiM
MASSNLQELMAILPQLGKVEWIGLRTARRATLQNVQQVEVSETDGLTGDHYNGNSRDRQVTLVQAEHLEAVAGILKKDKIDPRLTRRNIVISGINLLAFNERQFQIGEEVILEMTGHCHPCSRMETNLGPGGYNAMRGHGGIAAKVIQGGKIKAGDPVKLALPKTR